MCGRQSHCQERGRLVREPSLSSALADEAAVVPKLCSEGLARPGKTVDLEQALLAEQIEERERDRAYWQPLKAELERLRHLASAKARATGNLKPST
jgi:hypothetical protein